MITKAIIPAAGKGTRLYPLTLTCSKEMIDVNGVPTIRYIVDEAINSGIKDIYLIINKNKKDIITYFDSLSDLKANIHYLYQEEQLGLGHAVLMAKDVIKDDYFACLLGDDLFDCPIPALKQVISVYEKYNTQVVGTLKVKDEFVHLYGSSKILDDNDPHSKVLLDIIEKPQGSFPSNYVSQGRYVLSNKIFDFLEKKEIGTGGEIQLTDSLSHYAKTYGSRISVIDGIRFDIGKLEDIENAREYFKRKRI
ncbi:MAG: UTP--glucose-1-phosphate uridylyltransferase [Acholeplasmatales bacterium]|jgi:UTP--glucose-1-phosphate uridylyltransferase|nr:UTP--glucose-1-phosphate uridylyltransferase [Acholeplasmatales bacterium]